MILGHYAVAFAAKRGAPRTSLGTLVFAAQWLDELWPILVLLGVERVRPAPGLMPASQLEFVSYPVSHSLLTGIAWGVLIGVVYYVPRRYRRGAWIVGLAVVSHWLLDAPMHQADLPLWPGSSTFVGGGLWRSVPATIAVEIGVFAVGLGIYLRTTRARDVTGVLALWGMVVVLLAIFFAGIFGPPPSSGTAVAVGALGLWLFVPWAAWIDRHRMFRQGRA
jgi:membrane-bound metal-dependent hydrolase YbcI (DUF457 family)